MKSLLEELKTVDLETWKDIRFQLINIFSVNELEDINLRTPLVENAYNDIIQGCIQRAIARHSKEYFKEWFFEIIQVESKEYVGKIYRRSGMVAWAGKDSPGRALLAAYIRAVRA